MYNKVKKILLEHDNYRNKCINLLPSENVLSPLAKSAMISDVGQRYYFETAYSPKEGASYSYNGTKYIEEILTLGQQVAQKVFNADYVSLYPISGHLANIAILFAFTNPGDTIICHSPQSGGYPGLDKKKLPKYLNLDVRYFPMDKKFNEMINVEETINLINKVKPRLVIFSSANTLFPIPLKKISDATRKNKSILIYDGSHPLGLIANNEFQNPLSEGADILVGGTQKSFPGPQGAIIATNKYVDKIKEVEHFVTVDNPHFNRIAALAVSLLEMKKYGSNYAKQIIKNSQTLASELYKNGIPVLYKELNYTQSHMFKIKTFSDYQEYSSKLERANIIIDNSGRIGTNEMTRMGMKEKEMKIIAEYISIIYNDANSYKIKDMVIELKSKFQLIKYC